MLKRTYLILALILLTAFVLTLFKVPIASSQGLVLVAKKVDGELPVNDAASELWAQSTAIDIPLSAQNTSKPFLLNTKTKSVSTRALHNGTQLAILVEWADETQNDSTVAIQDFRDGAALQFPVVQGQPFFCMGQQGGNVNIWHWKADWQAGLLARREMEETYPDMYVDQYPFATAAEGKLASVADYTDTNYLPALEAGNPLAAIQHASPVEDLVAGGFGSLTSQALAAQNVQGYGTWADNKWTVIFSRDLASPETDDASFALGKAYSIALAVWDGANNERNGQKSTSQWVTFQLSSGPRVKPASQDAIAGPPSWLRQNLLLIIFGFLTLILLAILFIYSRLPE